MAQWNPNPDPPVDWWRAVVFLAVVVVGSALITVAWWGIGKAAGW
jgi:hypothetical protein